MDLLFLFRYEHIPSLIKVPLPAPNETLPHWFHGNFAAMFVLIYWLRKFLFSPFANRFELRCEPKQLMLLYYIICPRYLKHDFVEVKIELQYRNGVRS